MFGFQQEVKLKAVVYMNIKSLIYELNRVLIHGEIVQVDQGLNGGRQLWVQLVVVI